MSTAQSLFVAVRIASTVMLETILKNWFYSSTVYRYLNEHFTSGLADPKIMITIYSHKFSSIFYFPKELNSIIDLSG